MKRLAHISKKGSAVFKLVNVTTEYIHNTTTLNESLSSNTILQVAVYVALKTKSLRSLTSIFNTQMCILGQGSHDEFW